MTIGSLLGDDIRALEDLDLLPRDTEVDTLSLGDTGGDVHPDTAVASSGSGTTRAERHGTSGNVSWFEEMISGSALGQTQRMRRGMGMSADGTTRVEWEVTEVGAAEEDSDSGTGRGKRKIADVSGHDSVMKE